MDSPKNVHIVVPKELRERLKARKRPHQAIAGVIEELLSLVIVIDKIEWEIISTSNANKQVEGVLKVIKEYQMERGK